MIKSPDHNAVDQPDLGTLLRMALRKAVLERREMTVYFLEMALLDLESPETSN